MTCSPEEKLICADCIGERFLSDEVETLGNVATCSYCADLGSCYSIRKLANRVHEAFEKHYERTSTEPEGLEMAMHHSREFDYDWDREGELAADAISGAADISEQAASDVRETLANDHYDRELAEMQEEGEYDEDSCYAECNVDDEHWRIGWLRMERSLLHEARLFNTEAAAQMKRVFNGIDLMETRDGKPIVRLIGPSSPIKNLLRARVFQAQDELHEALCRPDLHVGPPPSSQALAGRMNASGVSVFYGATTAAIALAEVRPPVGSYVVVTKFKVLKELRILDLVAARKIQLQGSIFDSEHTEQLERAMFLDELARRMSKTVLPIDEQQEYLPSQAVADYLATRHKPRIDGIFYPSPQGSGAGFNIALLHHASRVRPMDIPAGTKLTASRPMASEEELGDYVVWETVPKEDATKPSSGFDVFLPDDPYESINKDCREESLEVVESSTTVRVVDAVKIKAEKVDVSRHRSIHGEDYGF